MTDITRRFLLLALWLLWIPTACTPVCDHLWQDADCLHPALCRQCGRTEGEALGHTYTASSCTQGAVCTVCGAKGNAPLGHTTEKGICARCGHLIGGWDIRDLPPDARPARENKETP